jgi:hypothetical protein
VTLTCPHCGEEIEIAVTVPSPTSGRDWRRLAMWAVLALAALGACTIVYGMR